MGGNDAFRGEPRLAFQGVDVLREAAQQQALAVQQCQEVVRGGGPEVAREQFLQSISLA